MKRSIFLVMLMMVWPVEAQEEAQLITAENVRQLQSVETLDFADLPEGVTASSGLFAMNADGTKIVTFANHPDDPFLSQAVLWGYGEHPILQPIENGSLVRFLSPDGRCLYAGYRGHYIVWELTAEAVTEIYRADLRDDYNVVDMWLGGDTPCTTTIFAEISVDDGSSLILAPDLSVLHQTLFGAESVARVGRVVPPLALTIDFDGVLYRWDMTTQEITATVEIGDLATFGAVNRDGTHYVWLETDFGGLHLVDFEVETTQFIAPIENVYISHLQLTHQADVILGVDPRDAPGTVSAWFVESGERIELGNFRRCERSQPDLARLSSDGTTLVIGCDTGIDVWRVVEE